MKGLEPSTFCMASGAANRVMSAFRLQMPPFRTSLHFG